MELNQFYRDHYRAVLVLAYSLVHDWGTAEDVTQDAFVDVCRNRARLASHPRPDLWVRRAAISRATSLHRRRRVEHRANARANGPSTIEPSDDPEWLLDLVDELPSRQRTAFVVVHIGQLTVTEAADAVGVTESTLRTHLERARRSLRTRLADLERQDNAPAEGDPRWAT